MWQKRYTQINTLIKKISFRDRVGAATFSASPVSYVANGRKKECRPGGETSRRIRKTAPDTTGRPDLAAGPFRRGEIQTRETAASTLSDPYFSRSAPAPATETMKRDSTGPSAISYDDAGKINKTIGNLIDKRIEGKAFFPVKIRQAVRPAALRSGLFLLGKRAFERLFDKFFFIC